MTVAFGSQAARFDTAGIHPDRKLPGHFIQYTYTREATNNEMAHIGKPPSLEIQGSFLFQENQSFQVSPVTPESGTISDICFIK